MEDQRVICYVFGLSPKQTRRALGPSFSPKELRIRPGSSTTWRMMVNLGPFSLSRRTWKWWLVLSVMVVGFGLICLSLGK